MCKPLKAFVTYSHENKAERDKLIKRLAVMKRAGDLETWYDGKISGGDPWNEEIAKNLAESDILICLVSVDSLASDACNNEIMEAIDRGIKVIPVILEVCDWKGEQQIAGLQALPEDGKPITKWIAEGSENDGWQNVVDGIRRTIRTMEGIDEKKDTAGFSNLFQAGNAFMLFKRFDEAIRMYSFVIELKSNFAWAYTNRGIAYGELGDYVSAIEDFNKRIDLEPDYAGAYSNRGNAYRAMNEHDRAIEDCNKAIALNPNLVEAYNNRGNIYKDWGEYDRAIADYNKAIELNPDYAKAYYNRDHAYRKKKDSP